MLLIYRLTREKAGFSGSPVIKHRRGAQWGMVACRSLGWSRATTQGRGGEEEMKEMKEAAAAKGPLEVTTNTPRLRWEFRSAHYRVLSNNHEVRYSAWVLPVSKPASLLLGCLCMLIMCFGWDLRCPSTMASSLTTECQHWTPRNKEGSAKY